MRILIHRKLKIDYLNMRTIKIIFIAIFLFMSVKLCAQDYSIDTFNYDFYVGTWEYKTTTEHFILKTWKKTHYFPGDTFIVLKGVFKYTKYGFTVYDYLYLYGKAETYYTISFMIIPDLSQKWGQSILSVNYKDSKTPFDTRAFPHASFFTIASKNPAKVSWHIVPCYDDMRIRLKPGQIAFTIPTDMILTKVEE